MKTLLQQLRRFPAEAVAIYSGVVVALAGAVFLAGWPMNLVFLRRIRAGLPEIMPLTALGLTLAGLALAQLTNRHPPAYRRWFGLACATGTTLIGMAMLMDNAFCHDLGVDRWSAYFFGQELSYGDFTRPSFHAAILLSLIGPALLLLDIEAPIGTPIAQLLAILAIHTLIFILLGFAFGNDKLYVLDWADNGISVHAAALASILCFGLLCARPTGGFTEILCDGGSGGVVMRRLILAPFLVPLIVGIASFVGQLTGMSKDIGGWLFGVGIFAVSTLIIWWVASIIHRAENEIRRLNADLERRVLERTADLEEANRDLKQKNGENEMFVYSVSHDLRSPLVNLQGFSKELDKGCKALGDLFSDEAIPSELRQRGDVLLKGKMAKSLGFIQAAVLRLSGIIDALLRLSRAGRVEYRWELVDVARFVERIVASAQGTIQDRKVRVTIGDLPRASGDPTALEQIFANLIGNALAYLDPARSGLIEVGCLPLGAANVPDGFRVYYVKDNGLGIAEAHRTRIFQVFQRAHPQVGVGEGIGLAIVVRIAERHRGRVWVESSVGKGSTFFVALPSASKSQFEMTIMPDKV